MLRIALMAGVLAVALGSGAMAQPLAERQKCLSNVQDVLDMQSSSEFPNIGEIAQGEVDELVEIATYLCENANYLYANQLLEIVRGMLVSE